MPDTTQPGKMTEFDKYFRPLTKQSLRLFLWHNTTMLQCLYLCFSLQELEFYKRDCDSLWLMKMEMKWRKWLKRGVVFYLWTLKQLSHLSFVELFIWSYFIFSIISINYNKNGSFLLINEHMQLLIVAWALLLY